MRNRVSRQAEARHMARPSLSKKSGYGWAFSHLYGTIRMGDERCLNEENWTVES